MRPLTVKLGCSTALWRVPRRKGYVEGGSSRERGAKQGRGLRCQQLILLHHQIGTLGCLMDPSRSGRTFSVCTGITDGLPDLELPATPRTCCPVPIRGYAMGSPGKA